MIDYVLKANLALCYICTNDVSYVVPQVKQLDERIEFLLYQVLIRLA